MWKASIISCFLPYSTAGLPRSSLPLLQVIQRVFEHVHCTGFFHTVWEVVPRLYHSHWPEIMPNFSIPLLWHNISVTSSLSGSHLVFWRLVKGEQSTRVHIVFSSQHPVCLEEVPPLPPVLQRFQSQFLQPVFICPSLDISDCLNCPSLNSFQEAGLFFCIISWACQPYP